MVDWVCVDGYKGGGFRKEVVKLDSFSVGWGWIKGCFGMVGVLVVDLGDGMDWRGGRL